MQCLHLMRRFFVPLPSYNNCNPGGPVGLPQVPGPQDAQRRVAIIVTTHFPDDFWRNLSFNKAQTDWIVNQKHILMLFAIKIKYI